MFANNKSLVAASMMVLLLVGCGSSALAQRMQQPLGRGVVAVRNGSNVLVSWRRLAQEPEDVQYNVYVNGTKVNASPLKNTNWQTTSSRVPVGARVAVTTVSGGVESELSVPFVAKSFDMRNMFMSISFDGSPLAASQFNTSYVWPVDLDGDGEMDYVVNRKSNTNALDSYVEGYLRTGEHLWTVKLGPNELSCSGQDDQITAADMDCDGRGDVVIQSSDGTQFWNPDTRSFGLFVGGRTTGDTDGDGIIDYETQATRNAPRYISVIDGLTGREKASVEQTYNQHYNRTNRASLMGDEYNKHVGHMGVFFPDGIHPAIVMEWHMRGTGGDHHYYNLGVGYDFAGGTAGQLRVFFNTPTGAPAFHQIRIGDTDGDGRDEMMVGGYTMDHDGSILFNTGIAHGDRFRISDIDPERPGLETFAVQQYAGDQLGMILYDARTGESIKRWYMPSTGDVGRGECMDVDASHLGWEMWSTMDGNMYDAKGNLIPGLSNQYPCEGVWWDADPDRETVQTSDSHYNVYIQDFYRGREVEFAKLSNWRYTTVYAKRAAFWGDIIGDWREELVLLHKENDVTVGIVGVSTDYTTTVNNIYCLQQDPHYAGDCTTKGYYQSPNPGFYLGYDMPRPQLPPVMRTDLVLAPDATAWSGTAFTDFQRSQRQAYADGKSVLIDLYAPQSVALATTASPAAVYAMPVHGQRVAISGSGSFAGTMDLWKSQQGTLAVDVPLAYSGTTYISEGTLEANATIAGAVELRARGTLAGNATLAGTLTLEGALNYEGGRLSPGTPDAPFGTITLHQGLNVNRRLYYEASVAAAVGGTPAGSDMLAISGDLAVTAPLILHVIPTDGHLPPATYPLITFTGAFSGDANNISVMGLEGLSYNIKVDGGKVSLVVNEQRQAAEGVVWTGAESGVWDYQTSNWQLGGSATDFVAGDAIVFNDDAERTTVQATDLMPVGGVTFANNEKTFTISGDGGFSGTGGITVNGSGRVNLRAKNSTYTGATVINAGTVEVTELADGGLPSSIGAATSAAANFKIGRARLIVSNTNAATNRQLTLAGDTASIQVASGVVALKGKVGGSGTLRKEGAGQLNLTADGANTYTGGTVLAAGTLAQGTWNTTFGTATSLIDVTGNAAINIFDNNSTSQTPTFLNRLNIQTGRTLTMRPGQRCKIGGTLLGQGTMNISFPYVRGDFYMNCAAFEGTVNVTGGQFRITAATDLSKGVLKLGAGVYAVHTQSQSATEVDLITKIGSLQSTAADAQLARGTWNVGYLGRDDTYAGKFTGTLNKYGNGTLTLTGASSGALNIYAGTVYANTTSAPATTGATTVRSGATLAGTGQLQNVTVQSGATLTAGKSATLTGTLTVAGTLTMQRGATLLVKARHSGTRATADAFRVAGRISLTAPTIAVTTLGDEPLQAGDELRLFTGDGTLTISGDITLQPERPAAGLLWDTSRLATEGVLSVATDPTGIGSVEQTTAPAAIYDLGGRRHDSATQPGIYVVDGRKRVIR